MALRWDAADLVIIPFVFIKLRFLTVLILLRKPDTYRVLVAWALRIIIQSNWYGILGWLPAVRFRSDAKINADFLPDILLVEKRLQVHCEVKEGLITRVSFEIVDRDPIVHMQVETLHTVVNNDDFSQGAVGFQYL